MRKRNRAFKKNLCIFQYFMMDERIANEIRSPDDWKSVFMK